MWLTSRLTLNLVAHALLALQIDGTMCLDRFLTFLPLYSAKCSVGRAFLSCNCWLGRELLVYFAANEGGSVRELGVLQFHREGALLHLTCRPVFA